MWIERQQIGREEGDDENEKDRNKIRSSFQRLTRALKD